MPNYTTLLAPGRKQVHPRGQRPTRPLVSLPANTPERRLLAAIIIRAARDMCSRANLYNASDAARYIAGDNFEIDCLALGFDPEIARERIGLYVHLNLHPEAQP